MAQVPHGSTSGPLHFLGDKRANLKTEVIRKQSTPNFPKNKHFLPPDPHMFVYVLGGKKFLFFGKFGVLCFLVSFVLRLALFPYHRRFLFYINDLLNSPENCIDYFFVDDTNLIYRNKSLSEISHVMD